MTSDDETCNSDQDMFGATPKKKDEGCITPRRSSRLISIRKSPGTTGGYLKSLREFMKGVPPPPSVTDSHWGAEDLLRIYRQNTDFHWTHKCSQLPDCHPKLGIYYNLSYEQEEWELLKVKYVKKFLLKETASTCGGGLPLPKTLSEKKKAKEGGWGRSPRTRVKYLTRRRLAFAPTSNISKRTILVQTNKKKAESEKIKNPKRALFQSPDTKGAKANGQLKGKKEVERTKRPLFTSGDEADEGLPQAKRKPPPSQPPPADSKRAINLANDPEFSSLSKHHQQKVMWAASSALRTVGVNVRDVRFRTAAKILCKNVCLAWKGKEKSSTGSTSDVLLSLAMESLSLALDAVWPPPPTPAHLDYTFVKDPPTAGFNRLSIASACLVVTRDDAETYQRVSPITLSLHSTPTSLDLYIPTGLADHLPNKQDLILDHLSSHLIRGRKFIYRFVKQVTSFRVVLETPHAIKVGVPFDLVSHDNYLDCVQISQQVTNIVSDIMWTDLPV